MKQKKIETHKIGLVGQAPSRRGDPRKPLAGLAWPEDRAARRNEL
jgi:hypothetical protein